MAQYQFNPVRSCSAEVSPQHFWHFHPETRRHLCLPVSKSSLLPAPSSASLPWPLDPLPSPFPIHANVPCLSQPAQPCTCPAQDIPPQLPLQAPPACLHLSDWLLSANWKSPSTTSPNRPPSVQTNSYRTAYHVQKWTIQFCTYCILFFRLLMIFW